MKKYDVFLSYRRDGGFETAKHLYDLLTRDGYSVSFDLDTLRDGFFDKELLKRIEMCTDFVIILDKHAFDRTVDPTFDPRKDWMRIELAYALKLEKKIINVRLSGFEEFPDNLPNDIKRVAMTNGPTYAQEYFDSFYEKLREFLKSKPRRSSFDVVKSFFASKFLLGLVLGVLVFFLGIHFFGNDIASEDNPSAIVAQTATEDSAKAFPARDDSAFVGSEARGTIVAREKGTAKGRIGSKPSVEEVELRSYEIISRDSSNYLQLFYDKISENREVMCLVSYKSSSGSLLHAPLMVQLGKGSVTSIIPFDKPHVDDVAFLPVWESGAPDIEIRKDEGNVQLVNTNFHDVVVRGVYTHNNVSYVCSLFIGARQKCEIRGVAADFDDVAFLNSCIVYRSSFDFVNCIIKMPLNVLFLLIAILGVVFVIGGFVFELKEHETFDGDTIMNQIFILVVGGAAVYLILPSILSYIFLLAPKLSGFLGEM